jgi:hypothetical protein
MAMQDYVTRQLDHAEEQVALARGLVASDLEGDARSAMIDAISALSTALYHLGRADERAEGAEGP